MPLPSILRNKFIYRPVLILAIGATLFYLTGFRDAVWTFAFWRHPSPVFTDVMSRSFYEGEWPGISDIGVTVPLLAFFWWLKIRKSNGDRPLFANQLRFIFISGFFGAFVTIHSFKWLVSRARPKVFDRDVLPQLGIDPAELYLPGFMGWDGPRGTSWNSFPSGHAGTCAVLLALAYLIPRTHWARPLVLSAVIVLTASMAVARSMAGMHWISDSVASFFLVWATVDFIWSRSKVKS